MDLDISQFYKDHYAKALNFAMRYIPDRSTAEDMVSDAVLGVLKMTHRTEGQTRSYFFTSIRNECLDYFRKNKKYRIKDIDTVCDIAEESTDIDPQEVKEKVIKKLHSYIKALPSKQRLIFELHYFEEKTNKEIAVITGLKYQTVKNQLYQAVKILRFSTKNKKPLKKKSHQLKVASIPVTYSAYSAEVVII